MSIFSRLGAAVLVAGVVTAGGFAVAADDGGAGTRGTLGPGLVTVDLDIHHSRFSANRLQVQQGTVVRFVVHNGDPIGHELVVGDEDVHARHSQGVEAFHPPVPGEVSVPPSSDGVTFYDFETPGTIVFACHLPGHVAYGMVGQIDVVAAAQP